MQKGLIRRNVNVQRVAVELFGRTRNYDTTIEQGLLALFRKVRPVCLVHEITLYDQQIAAIPYHQLVSSSVPESTSLRRCNNEVR